MPRTTLPLVMSALAVLSAGILILAAHPLGPMSAHMALHIALMNVAAPLLAALLVQESPIKPAALWAIAGVQILVLWAWHAPPIQRQLMDFASLNALGHALLFFVGFCFWQALLRLAPAHRWHSIPVLAVTGKLFCLLGVLLILAPRLLFDIEQRAHFGHSDAPAGLLDQQLAGLLMITACPLSYLVAGVIIASQIIAPRLDPTTSVRPQPWGAR